MQIGETSLFALGCAFNPTKSNCLITATCKTPDQSAPSSKSLLSHAKIKLGGSNLIKACEDSANSSHFRTFDFRTYILDNKVLELINFKG